MQPEKGLQAYLVLSAVERATKLRGEDRGGDSAGLVHSCVPKLVV